MENWEWEKLGDQINKTVQDAINSRDYNKLNQTINNTINQAMGGLGKGLHEAGDAVNKSIHNMWRDNRWTQNSSQSHPYQEDVQNAHGGMQGHPYREDAEQTHEGMQGRPFRGEARYKRKNGAAQYAYQYQRQDQALYKKTSGMKAGGTVLAIVGYTFGGIFLVLLAIALVGVFAAGGGVAARILLGTGTIFFLASVILAGTGTAMLGRVKRFRSYIESMHGKEYVEIKELAENLRKSPKFVARDVQKMIDRGWFRQGRLDDKRTCLMVSHHAYSQYQELMKHLEDQRRQEQEKKKAQAAQTAQDGNLDPQIREIIRTGDAYIKKIHECNDAIPGVEISNKISRMETLVDRIFDRVEQKPDCLPEIRRLMEYYLPTTVKLLEAYEDLDAQPVQGENIISSKKEIEGTLDTLNLAFEKLLDSLFQDTAWDVSSDISVLKTMLAQEGLAKDDF